MAITSTAPLRICMTSCLVLKFSMAILTTMIEISSTGLRICAPHSKHVCIVGIADWFVIFQELLSSIRHFCEGPGFYNNFRVIIFDSIYESFSTPFCSLTQIVLSCVISFSISLQNGSADSLYLKVFNSAIIVSIFFPALPHVSQHAQLAVRCDAYGTSIIFWFQHNQLQLLLKYTNAIQ